MSIKRVRTAFIVDSTTTPGQRYVVFADGPAFACTCPGYTYRASCKHVKAVEVLLADDPTPRAPMDDEERVAMEADMKRMWG